MIKKVKNWLSSNKDINFMIQRFAHNNICIFWIGGFLVIEQLFYGTIINSPGSIEGRVHLLTSVVAAFYVFLSKKLRKISNSGEKLWHHYFIISFGLFGFGITIFRSLFIGSGTLFSLPIIYIAVLYGFAFIFFIPPISSAIIYGIAFLILAFFLPVYNDKVHGISFIADLFSNSMIAWIASTIGYRRFENEYRIRRLLARKNNELMKLSTTDTLTQLFNRRKVDKVLGEWHNIAEKLNVQYAIILVDIDFFKRINDTFGHQIGDDILVEFGQILKNNTRKEDIIGRWGGEEFIILCQNTTESEAIIIAEKLRKAVYEHIFASDIKITSSFGVAEYKGGIKFSTVVSYADMALYESKSKGRNLVTGISQLNRD